MKNSARYRLCIALAAALLAPCILPAQVAYRWIVDHSRPVPADWSVFRGETFTLEPSFRTYGTDLSLSSATAVLYWQTNGMASAWWSAPAEIVTGAVDRVRAVWSPTNDVGAASYRYFIGIVGVGTTYRAHGTIRYSHAPGAAPNALPLPVPTIDFGTVTVANAPWATPAELAAEALLRSQADAAAVASAVAQSGTNTQAAVGAVSLAGLAAEDDRAASLQVLADVGNQLAPTNGVIAASGRGDLDTPSQSFGSGVWALGEFSPSWAQYAFRGSRGAEVYPGIDAPEGGWDADQWYLLEALNWVPGMTYDDLRLYEGPVALDPSGVYTSGILSPVTLTWTGTLPAGPLEYAAVASLPYVDSLLPTWPSLDTTTNLLWTVTVSNGHWLITSQEITP